jgi:hypothetical protein
VRGWCLSVIFCMVNRCPCLKTAIQPFCLSSHLQVSKRGIFPIFFLNVIFCQLSVFRPMSHNGQSVCMSVCSTCVSACAEEWSSTHPRLPRHPPHLPLLPHLLHRLHHPPRHLHHGRPLLRRLHHWTCRWFHPFSSS